MKSLGELIFGKPTEVYCQSCNGNITARKSVAVYEDGSITCFKMPCLAEKGFTMREEIMYARVCSPREVQGAIKSGRLRDYRPHKKLVIKHMQS